MANCHTRWDSVRVHNQVWVNALSCEGQVLLLICHTARTFLTVTRGELVTDLGSFDGPHFYFDEFVARLISSQHDLVNHSRLRVPQRLTCILHLLAHINDISIVKLILIEFTHLSNDDVVTTDLSSGGNKSINVQLVVWTMLATLSDFGIWPLDFFILSLTLIIRSEEHRPEIASVNARLVHHDGILLVISRIAGDCDD